MANYYTDHPEIGFYLGSDLMQRLVELKEHFYEDKDKYDEAPVDFGDARDRLLDALSAALGD